MPENIEDTLSRWIEAIGREERTPGPSTEIVAETLSAICQIKQAPKSNFRRTCAIAAAVGITIGLAAMIWFLAFSGEPAVTWGDVVTTASHARTETYRMTTYSENGTPAISTVMIKNHGFRRTEGSGEIVIDNWPARKQVALDTVKKVATVTNLLGKEWNEIGSVSGPIDMIERMKQNKPLGEKVIDGKPVVGFRSMGEAEGPGLKIHSTEEIWVDKKTHRVICIDDETENVSVVPGQHFWEINKWRIQKSRCRLDDFQWDVPLDDSLFSVVAPAGYIEKHGGNLGIKILRE